MFSVFSFVGCLSDWRLFHGQREWESELEATSWPWVDEEKEERDKEGFNQDGREWELFEKIEDF